GCGKKGCLARSGLGFGYTRRHFRGICAATAGKSTCGVDAILDPRRTAFKPTGRVAKIFRDPLDAVPCGKFNVQHHRPPDPVGHPQTDTGKPPAFLVAILNKLLSIPARADRRAAVPRAVVLAPTRELAIQIEKDARGIARQSGLRFALIYGGVDYDKQRELLR